MGRITQDLVQKRAEHNENCISTLEEIALHQQNIEKIEVLGQICCHLKILYLQNNLIGKIQNVHRLKELEYLNLAVNNITRIQNLQKCESLKKLDLTVNFVDKAGLLALHSLTANYNLRELFLLGNPCAEWAGYRKFVIAKLPHLQKLDGSDIKRSERIVALQELSDLEKKLVEELVAEGIDPKDATEVEDDSLLDETKEIPETGYLDEKGEMRRPWCPETRVLEHRESVKQEREKEEQRQKAQKDLFTVQPKPLERHQDFPKMEDGVFRQKNEGKWDFTLDESADGNSIVLDVAVSKYMDTSLIRADVQPLFVRLLIKGRLLQLSLPTQVMPDASVARRSTTSGHLILSMPKEDPKAGTVNLACVRSAPGKAARMWSKQSEASNPTPVSVTSTRKTAQGSSTSFKNITGKNKATEYLTNPVQKAKLQLASDSDDDDYIPPL